MRPRLEYTAVYQIGILSTARRELSNKMSNYSNHDYMQSIQQMHNLIDSSRKSTTYLYICIYIYLLVQQYASSL